ncbi:MAG: DNA replication/repair protein RecF [Oscillospiraceae bacterium]|nr:DNA replication/repair protein RecF [Oscillospiraceae bacterium]
MTITKLKLTNFRNYEEQEIVFDEDINIIYGDNAQGKTNIIEAIFICSLGKSFRTNKEKELVNVLSENESCKVEIFAKKRDREIAIKYEQTDKKAFYINNIKIEKLSDILGNIYCVLFAPDDISILKNEPSKRRRFLNIMISQLRPTYVYSLNQYSKVLEQRNNYLKQIKHEGKAEEMLEIWDEQLVMLGIKVYNYRKEFIEKINEKIKEIHSKSTDYKENIEIVYKTNISGGKKVKDSSEFVTDVEYKDKNRVIKIEEKYIEELRSKRRTDIQKGFTSVGIHRDDFETYINEREVSIYGSQGQKRTTIISLKLAEAEVIHEEKEEYPIILLDDFMSELDKKRIQGFLENIKKNQVMITGTDSFSIPNTKYKLYKVENGNVISV